MCSDTMCSDFGLFWQYTTYLPIILYKTYFFDVWMMIEQPYIWNFRSYFLKRLPKSTGFEIHFSRFFEKKLKEKTPKVIWKLYQKLYQSAKGDSKSFIYCVRLYHLVVLMISSAIFDLIFLENLMLCPSGNVNISLFTHI